ncbi:MAG: DNA mismatch repair endonuclease MutL [Candidatus Dormibacteria bacterium]
MTITLLDTLTVDSIAAGEVIERPASVLKELIENSLDAGATEIRIVVEEAGRRLIRVDDNGSGIVAEELALAFTRHATSKVRSVDDLARIATLGFRGEALASVAAVARIDCVSACEHGQGASLTVVAGEMSEVEPRSRARGTTVEVREVFRYTPARFRFLKEDVTESAALARVATEYAVAYPEVAFEARINDRQVLSTPGSGDLRDALSQTMGRAFGSDPLKLAGTVHDVSVDGLIAPPERSRPGRTHVLTFVNRRRVHHRPLQVAVEQAYRGLLLPGRFPAALVLITCPPAEVDVNVHPAKREVRFRDERGVFAAVERTVAATLAPLRGFRPFLEVESAYQPAAVPGLAVEESRRGPWPALALGIAPRPAATLPAASAGARPGPQNLRLVGQALDRYVVAESDDGLVVVDQHAAHERILFDRWMARAESGSEPLVQSLLVPQLVELDVAEVPLLEPILAAARALGLEAEAFGPATVRVTGTPPELAASRLELVLKELAGASTGPEDPRVTAARTLSCHSAIRFGQRLQPAEMQALLDDLALTPNGANCPHGRPTSVSLTNSDLERELRRR